MVQRRTNIHPIMDKVLSEKDPYTIAVTYEGPSHFSEEGSCAAHTKVEIKDICKEIVSHFYNTEHKYITRMVLYFKVDERDQIWLLWCGSLRVSDRDAPSQMPLNLAPSFTSPTLEAFNPANDDGLLKEADMKHLEMANDAIFYENYVKEKTSESPIRSSPNRHGAHGHKSGEAGEREEKGQRGAKTVVKTQGHAPHQAAFDWSKYPGIQDQYKELCADRDLVLQSLEDVFYEAYGHFLRHDPGTFYFEVDSRVAQTLSEDLLSDLMQFLKVEHAVPGEDHHVSNEDLCYAIPASHSMPVGRLADEAAKWVKRHYAAKEQELRDEASAMPQDDGAHAAQNEATEEEEM
jgi:hypothetical protein